MKKNVAFLSIIFMVLFASCAGNKKGCRSTWGMSGYSHCPSFKEVKKSNRYGYTYNPKTKVITVVDLKGQIICQYFQKTK
jgi:hypothetical protein